MILEIILSCSDRPQIGSKIFVTVDKLSSCCFVEPVVKSSMFICISGDDKYSNVKLELISSNCLITVTCESATILEYIPLSSSVKMPILPTVPFPVEHHKRSL